jgi:ribosome-associated heat shock protein Hsp15
MEETQDKLRLDKWLWFVRVVKTRGLAQELAGSGYVRINGQRVTSVAKAVHVGDVLTIALHAHVRVLKVTALPVRRGPAPEAQQHYEELALPSVSHPNHSEMEMSRLKRQKNSR